jgi:hypothetical protein
MNGTASDILHFRGVESLPFETEDRTGGRITAKISMRVNVGQNLY